MSSSIQEDLLQESSSARLKLLALVDGYRSAVAMWRPTGHSTDGSLGTAQDRPESGNGPGDHDDRCEVFVFVAPDLQRWSWAVHTIRTSGFANFERTN